MSSFVIKIIAIITMLCDHFSDSIIGHISILNVIGRIAFPLFAFQLVIGYCHTNNIKKYFSRLFIFALISQVPFSVLMYIMGGSIWMLNIFFTLLLGLLALYIYDSKLNKILKLFLILSVIGIAELLNVDYKAWGVVLIMFIRLFYPNNIKLHSLLQNQNKVIQNIVFIFGMLVLCIIRFMPYFNLISMGWLISELIFTFIPVVFMLLYNGKKGLSLKYFFYAFYPVHLLILDFIALCQKGRSFLTQFNIITSLCVSKSSVSFDTFLFIVLH